MKFEIVCDSAADLPKEYIEEAEVKAVPFYVSFDGKRFYREGIDISVTDFYKTMAEHSEYFPSSSMPSVNDYLDVFLPLVKEKMPVICICLTEKFSGSVHSAESAKMILEEEYKDAQIFIIDSQLVTALEGLLVAEAVRLRDLGLEAKDASARLKAIRKTGHIFFTTNDLKYLEHGGRIGKIASIAGSLFNIKPLLHFYEGGLGTTELCRGRKKSLQVVVQKFFRYLEENKMDLKGFWFATGIGIEIPEYESFKQTLEEKFREKGIRPDGWIKMQIGATIGVHTGPYPIGLGFLKKCEV